MNISTFMIAMLIFSGIVLGLMEYYNEIITVYSPENSTASADFDKFNQTFIEYNEKLSAIENKTTSFNIKDPSTWGDGSMAFLSVAGLIMEMPTLFIKMINNMLTATDLSFPEWLGIIITTGIILFVMMKIASIFLRKQGGDI